MFPTSRARSSPRSMPCFGRADQDRLWLSAFRRKRDDGRRVPLHRRADRRAEANGLSYFRARMYSPMLGRFLQIDPAGTAGGVNLYAYGDNDPLNLLDILGLAPDNPQGNGGGQGI